MSFSFAKGMLSVTSAFVRGRLLRSARVIDILDRQVELVRMTIGGAAVLRGTVGEDLCERGLRPTPFSVPT